MTDRATRNLKSSLLALMLAILAGYGLLAWSFPSRSHAQAVLSSKLEQKAFYDADLLQDFYQARDMRPVWLRGLTAFQPRAEGVLKILEQSWTHGLNPESYHVPALKTLLAQGSRMNRYEFDMLLSDAVIRYARDLTGMRGGQNGQERAAKYWREPMEAKDILEKISTSSNPVQALRSMAPTGTLYQALRERLVALAVEASEPATPVRLQTPLKPGRNDKGVPALRARLGLAPATANETVYDDTLAAAVMRFQRLEGLDADGVIRAKTLAALNRNGRDRINQIIANMERLRWIGQERPDRYVLVNIPSASLWAVEDGKVAMEMPVIIGKTARPTYSFKTEITGVRFNPNWTVPPTIKNEDFLPMLRHNPQALAERGIRITYQGRLIDPAKVPWETVTERDLSQVKMIQNPGDDNPLGKIRVIMENPYNIYLHDTNHREMFSNDERTLSSGCIRVAEPEKLADFILRKNDGWSGDKARKLIDSGRMRDVATEHKLPVYITYQTIWLDSEGNLIYGPDVYGQDARLSSMLQKAGGINIPHNIQKQDISL